MAVGKVAYPRRKVFNALVGFLTCSLFVASRIHYKFYKYLRITTLHDVCNHVNYVKFFLFRCFCYLFLLQFHYCENTIR